MADISEVLAHRDVIMALYDLVVDSCNIYGGLKLNVAQKMGMAIVGQLEKGAPISSATNVVKAIRRHAEPRIHGVTWVVIRDGRVAMERCEKKARVLGVGEWFIPGGKIEGDESELEALYREIGEEWPNVTVESVFALPIVEGSAVPPGPRGTFLMRPFAVAVGGAVPMASSEYTEIRWFPVEDALKSPVVQVRMMVAAALNFS